VSSTLQALPGFRDFYPADCARRQWIFSVWRDAAARFGFQEYDGPPLESLELFTRKSGEEIIEQLYQFEDRGGRGVALRPEMTPTFARMVGARHRDFKKPLKWFAIPQLFRSERPQKGRKREHFQFNADLVGANTAAEDAEILALALEALRGLGLTEKDIRLRLSSRELWEEQFRHFGLVPDQYRTAYEAVDKIERESPEWLAKKMGSAGISAEQQAAIADFARSQGMESLPASPARDRLVAVMDRLKALGFGGWVVPDFTIVRGLAYYTGVVFEVFALDAQGAYTGRAVAGGGRYDTLLKNLAGVDLPAVGFGMGDVVLGELLEEKGLAPSGLGRSSAYVVVADPSAESEALGLVADLRRAGYRVEYPLAGAGVGKQFQAAEASGVARAVVVDARIKEGRVDVKNLKDRTQITVERADLIETLRNLA
jgi:histidyl-tRNA synthetase